MIEITIRLNTPDTARRFAKNLRALAADEAHPGQDRAFRSAAVQLERLTRPVRYTPRVQRPKNREIDELAIRRVVRGERPLPVLSRTEARLACLQLTQRGHSAAEVAERIRVVKRTVERWRAEDQRGAVA